MGLARIRPAWQTEVSRSASAVQTRCASVTHEAGRHERAGQMPGYFRTVCSGRQLRRLRTSPQSTCRHHACFVGRRQKKKRIINN